MGAHIFLVGEENFKVCIRKGVYGCVKSKTERYVAEVVAGMLSIQPGDLVFFYVKNRGIYGLWKIVSEIYFDETRIWSNDEQLFPYRLSFEPTVGYFPKPVSLIDILDLRDKERIWTFDLNPVQQKNQYKITMSEAQELLRLLLRNNPMRKPIQPIPSPYARPQTSSRIDVDLSSSQQDKVRYEGWLNAWFMRALARGDLKHMFGGYREFLNLVPTTFNKVMDVFLTHVATIDSIDILYKYTCIELKTDRAVEKDLQQILRYEDWLARKLAAGDHEMVQSVLVARRFANDIVDYVKTRRRIEEKTVRLITYHISGDRQDIELVEEDTLN